MSYEIDAILERITSKLEEKSLAGIADELSEISIKAREYEDKILVLSDQVIHNEIPIKKLVDTLESLEDLYED